jgi:protein-tyrosine phosphatase
MIVRDGKGNYWQENISYSPVNKEKGKTVDTKVTTYERCFHSHPALALGEFKIYGGNASTPAVKDADIYVALDRGSYDKPSYPWKKGPISILFRVTDMQEPDDKKEFRNMVVWLAEQVREGKKVHIGCIGGHGRTGTLLAALVAHMGVSDDPIAYVRTNYCKKAVESTRQIDFLVKEYGAKSAEPSKKPVVWKKDEDEYEHYSPSWKGKGATSKGKSYTGGHGGYDTYDPDADTSWYKKPKSVDSGAPQTTTYSVFSDKVTWSKKDLK